VKKLFCLKNKHGFTLIELIVVIAIIGILSAIAVPSMIGYINSAKNTALKANCRNLVTSGTTFAVEKMAQNSAYLGKTYDNTTLATKDADILELSPYIGKPVGDWSITIDANGIVTFATYTENGKQSRYTGSTGVYDFP
jgi:prepilin-type N-terminal cleavage/methylation domain-containing protein